MEDILAKATLHKQEHLVQHYHSLDNPELQRQFLQQISKIDFQQCAQLFQHVYLQSKNAQEKPNIDFSPVSEVATHEDLKQFSKQFDSIGYESILKGEVAVCIMSGGQGTRLGFDHPKGMFDLGLQSKLSLFGFFAKRLLRLNILAREIAHLQGDKCHIKWYLMTSEMNHEEIVNFFKNNSYFGYDSNCIVFFPQGGIPALDYNCKVILEEFGKISLAPGGNGAIYTEMKQKGVLDHMCQNSVKYIYMGPVDNVLMKLGDPTSLGYLIKNNLQIVSHYIRKRSPDEKVGLHVSANGKIKVCEYSELSKEVKELRDNTGGLVFNHGTRASMYVTVEFIRKLTEDKETMTNINKKYHLAEKKIKCLDLMTGQIVKPTQNNGVKFELFYFDVFEEANRIGLFETLRDDEFAPLKNAEGQDSPQTARQYLKKLHRKWLEESGVVLEGEGDVEINPRRSYNGQGLRGWVLEKFGSLKVTLPIYID